MDGEWDITDFFFQGDCSFNSMRPSRSTGNGRLSGDASGLTSSINVDLKMGTEPLWLLWTCVRVDGHVPDSFIVRVCMCVHTKDLE